MTFIVRPMTQADYPRLVEIQASQVPVPNTVEELIRADQMMPPDVVRYQTAAVAPEGVMVGYGSGGWGPVTRPGFMSVNVRIDRAWRRQGAGQALFADQLRFACEHGKTAMEATVRDEDPADLAWAERRGFAVKHHRFASKLDLASWEPERWRPALEAVAAGGIRFGSLADYPQDDETLQRFLDAFWELHMDTPGSEALHRPTFAQFKQELSTAPYWDPANVRLARDGDHWAAMAWVGPEQDGSYYHTFTGVFRDYRGRGLSTAIKVAAIEYVKAKGAPCIRTHNDETNQRMLAVNRKFGYVSEPGVYALEKQL
ncbi:MAG TPA: GNAT family N-acetyltransferase [Symbiobacteriaceae bacterium]|nr:GNAT family N-acetyltransferase [Symbiobacteriaceae bacterium]